MGSGVDALAVATRRSQPPNPTDGLDRKVTGPKITAARNWRRPELASSRGELVMCRGIGSIFGAPQRGRRHCADPAIGPSRQRGIGVVALAAARRRAPVLFDNIGIERV
jgi:hypothetical protein